MKAIVYLIIFGIIGLVVGYFLFARFGGHYVNVGDLFFNDKGLIGQLGDAISGGEKIRQKIYISGAVGGVVGLLLGAVSGGRKR